MKRTVTVFFEAEHEVHAKKKFQDDGHFVPAMRKRDANGQPTMKERPWKSREVHALNLFAFTMENGQRVKQEQVARSVADSLTEASTLLSEQITNTFWAMYNALKIAGQSQDAYRALMRERDALLAYACEKHEAKQPGEVLMIVSNTKLPTGGSNAPKD